jgi:hypothetical protein
MTDMSDKKSKIQDIYIREIRDQYMPAFSIKDTEIFLKWNPPSSFICCKGCKEKKSRHERCDCDCCLDHCRCCAGACLH